MAPKCSDFRLTQSPCAKGCEINLQSAYPNFHQCSVNASSQKGRRVHATGKTNTYSDLHFHQITVAIHPNKPIVPNQVYLLQGISHTSLACSQLLTMWIGTKLHLPKPFCKTRFSTEKAGGSTYSLSFNIQRSDKTYSNLLTNKLPPAGLLWFRSSLVQLLLIFNTNN